MISPSSCRKFLRYSSGPSPVLRTKRPVSRVCAAIIQAPENKGLDGSKRVIYNLSSVRHKSSHSPPSEFLIALERESPNLNASGQLVFARFPQLRSDSQSMNRRHNGLIPYKTGTIVILQILYR